MALEEKEVENTEIQKQESQEYKVEETKSDSENPISETSEVKAEVSSNHTSEQLSEESNDEAKVEVNTNPESTEQSSDSASEESSENQKDDSKDTPTYSENIPEKSKEDEALEEKVEELSDETKVLLVAELRGFFDSGTPIEVSVLSKGIGGFRVTYKELPMFLPFSHFSLSKRPDESEFENIIGSNIQVAVHEIKEEEGKYSIIVSRKKIIENEFWDNLNVGEVVTGTVTSTPSFGVFLDIGGVEGLCHVSRLSKARIENPATFCKKGDKFEVKIIDIDKEKKKISLSRKELEPSLWAGVEELFLRDNTYTGIVRRITDFGVYVELKTGVDGLLRNSEISWTKRVNDAKKMYKPGDKIEVYLLNISENKETATLSVKRTKDNPWETMSTRFPMDAVYHAEVLQSNDKGILFALNDEVDGFMPKSKLRGLPKEKQNSFEVGSKAEIKIVEIDAENESLILAPSGVEETQKQNNSERVPKDKFKGSGKSSSFALGDLLAEKMKESLKNIG